MKIIAFNSRSDAKKSAGNWSSAYAKSTVHTIPNTVSKINTWGICLGCHDGTHTVNSVLAPKVQPHHALPTNISPTQAYCGTGTTYGLGQYLPARANFNDISNMNYFGDFFRPTGTRPRTTTNAVGGSWGSVQCGNRVTGSIASRSTTYYSNQLRSNGRSFKGVAMPTTVATPTTDGQMTIPNPWTGATHNTNGSYNFAAMIDQIAVFASQTAAAQQAYSAEVIGVTSAQIVGSNLVVVATSNKSANCSTLTLQTGAGNATFNTSCQATIAYTYPTNGRTINVVNTSTTTPSIPVMNYPIGGVAALDAWSNLYSGVPTASPVAAGSFTVGTGTQRILLVSVAMEYGTAANPTIGATYGGTALNEIAVSANSQREAVWMGYLVDSGVGSGAKALSVTYSGSIGTVSAMHVKWSSFTGVNQTYPIYSSNAVSAGAVTVANNAVVSYANSGMTVAVSANGGTPATVAVTATPTLTAGTVVTTNAQSSNSFVSAKHVDKGSYASGGISFTWSGTTSAWSAMVAASLQP